MWRLYFRKLNRIHLQSGTRLLLSVADCRFIINRVIFWKMPWRTVVNKSWHCWNLLSWKQMKLAKTFKFKCFHTSYFSGEGIVGFFIVSEPNESQHFHWLKNVLTLKATPPSRWQPIEKPFLETFPPEKGGNRIISAIHFTTLIFSSKGGGGGGENEMKRFHYLRELV